MMINATLEAQDQRREFLGMTRLRPELTSYAATRAWEGQTMGWLINGVLAGRNLAVFQGVFYAFCCMLFVFVMPLTLLPGGMTALRTWVKFMFYFASWPVFFAILHSIGMNILGRYVRDVGLSLDTQTYLADSAYTAYAVVQMLTWSVPVIAWAVVSKGGYALVQAVQGLTANLGSGAGQAIADNTQTFDSQSFHNRNAMNYSVGQQQMSPSFMAGTRINDGSMDRMYDTQGGLTTTEAQTTGRVNFNETEALNKQGTHQLSQESAFREGLSAERSEALSQANQSAFDLTKNWGTDTRYSDSVSMDERRAVDESMRKAQAAVEKYSSQHSLGNENKVAAGAGFSVSSGFELFGNGGKAHLDLSTSLAASDSKVLQKMKDYGLTNEDVLNISKGMNWARSGQVSFGGDESQRTADTLRESLDHVSGLSERESASLERSDRIAETLQTSESAGGGWTANINDDILKKVAEDRFNGDINRAHVWKREKPGEFIAAGNEYVQERFSGVMKEREASFASLPGALKEKMSQHQERLISTDRTGEGMSVRASKSFTEFTGGAVQEKRDSVGMSYGAHQEKMGAQVSSVQSKVDSEMSRQSYGGASVVQQGRELKESFEAREGNMFATAKSGESPLKNVERGSLVNQGENNLLDQAHKMREGGFEGPKKMSQHQERLISTDRTDEGMSVRAPKSFTEFSGSAVQEKRDSLGMSYGVHQEKMGTQVSSVQSKVDSEMSRQSYGESPVVQQGRELKESFEAREGNMFATAKSGESPLKNVERGSLVNQGENNLLDQAHKMREGNQEKIRSMRQGGKETPLEKAQRLRAERKK